MTGAGRAPAGGRLAAPLTDPAAIAARLDVVAYFVGAGAICARTLRERLRARPTWSARCRACRWAAAARATWPRCATALIAAAALRAAACESRRSWRAAGGAGGRPLRDLGHHGELVDRLAARAGGRAAADRARRRLHRAGLRAGLDELRALRDESRRLIAELEARYRGETGVGRLKITPQQRAGLFHRGHGHPRRQAAEGRGSASSTARPWPAPCASPPSSWPSWNSASRTPPTRRWRSSWRCSPIWWAR